MFGDLGGGGVGGSFRYGVERVWVLEECLEIVGGEDKGVNKFLYIGFGVLRGGDCVVGLGEWGVLGCWV